MSNSGLNCRFGVWNFPLRIISPVGIPFIVLTFEHKGRKKVKRVFLLLVVLFFVMSPMFAAWSTIESSPFQEAVWVGECNTSVNGISSLGVAAIELSSSLSGMPNISVSIYISLPNSTSTFFKFFSFDELEDLTQRPIVPVDISVGDVTRTINVKLSSEDHVSVSGADSVFIVRSLYEGKDVQITIYYHGDEFSFCIDGAGSKKYIKRILDVVIPPDNWSVSRGLDGESAYATITKISNEDNHVALTCTISGYPFRNTEISAMSFRLYSSDDGTFWMDIPIKTAKFIVDGEVIDTHAMGGFVLIANQVANKILKTARASSFVKLVIEPQMEGIEYSANFDAPQLIKYLSYPYRFKY